MRWSALMNASPGTRARALDGDRPPRHHLTEGKRRHAAGRHHARQAARRAPRAGDMFRTRPAASVYFRPLIVSSSVSVLCGIKSRRDGLQLRKASNEKTRGDEQHDRQRQLRRHEQPPQVVPAAPERTTRPTSPAGILQRRVQIAAAQPQRRDDAEEDARGYRADEREEQHRAVQLDLADARHARRAEQADPVEAERTRAAGRRAAGQGENRLSVSNCTPRRRRLAPSEARTASSCCRATARATSRLATLAQAITSTSATAAISTTSERRTGPTTCSCSGTALNVRPPFGGYTSG